MPNAPRTYVVESGPKRDLSVSINKQRQLAIQKQRKNATPPQITKAEDINPFKAKETLKKIMFSSSFVEANGTMTDEEKWELVEAGAQIW